MNKNKKNNKQLKGVYDKIYETGKEKFFTKYRTSSAEIIIYEVLKSADFRNKKVLEVGCGTGETAIGMAKKGGRVLAVDYSKEAIKLAQEKKHKNLEFRVCEYEHVKGKFDIVVLQETLEHLDNPLMHLKKLKNKLNRGGKIIFTCPSFMNVRGYVWMTLQKLFDVPMSLTDVNFICPFDVQGWAAKLNMKLKWKTFDFDSGNGPKLITDFTRRLPNALRDARMKGNVDSLLSWLGGVVAFDHKNKFSGAKGLYILEKI